MDISPENENLATHHDTFLGYNEVESSRPENLYIVRHTQVNVHYNVFFSKIRNNSWEKEIEKSWQGGVAPNDEQYLNVIWTIHIIVIIFPFLA